MATCVIRRVDKVNLDALLDAQCTKANDFIAIQDDGFFFGTKIVGSTDYDILNLPRILWTDILYLLEVEALPASSLYRRKRGRKLKNLQLPNRNSNAWRGNIVSRNWNLAALQARLDVKVPLNDPNII